MNCARSTWSKNELNLNHEWIAYVSRRICAQVRRSSASSVATKCQNRVYTAHNIKAAAAIFDNNNDYR